MIKRSTDISISIFILILTSPILFIFSILIWLGDRSNPIYVAKRIGKDGKEFNFYKLRSMVINADVTGVDSTSASDIRITSIGKLIRKFKIDELPQLWHVLMGKMSLVGPRPNVWNDVKIYTEVEKKLLTVKPGITDFSSIVFSDEGEILSKFEDPDLKYNQLIRPWKSRLGLFYIKKRSFILDMLLIFITIVAIFKKKIAYSCIVRILKYYNADIDLIRVCRRDKELEPFPPPGSKEIVKER